jgi:hypothetical protein
MSDKNMTMQRLLQNKNISQENQNPYLMLGYGMIAYFNMLLFLITMFFIFTLLALVPLFIYSSYNGMEGLANYAKA